MNTSASSSTNILKFILYAIALHSFIVGLGLVIQIPGIMAWLGFGNCHEHFFPAQGGVFHIVMAIGYSLAARNPLKYQCLITFTIIVKALATVFLLSYFLLFEMIWMVLISGLTDGLMCIAVFWARTNHQKYQESLIIPKTR
jgi:hypothetical protein